MQYDPLTIERWIRNLYDSQLGPGAGDKLWIEPYTYPLSFTGFASVGGNASGVLAINANAAFILTRISSHANVAGAVQNVGNKTVPYVRAQITDAGSSRPFFNSAVDLENLASNQFPMRYLPFPRYISANSSLLVQLTGYGSVAESYGIELAFEGMAVRQFSQPISMPGT